MQLFVAGLSSGTFTLDVRSSDDVKRVKELVFERQGVPIVEQRLVYDGKQLQDGRTLASYGIEKESTVQIHLRGRGGGRGCGGDMSKPLTDTLDEMGNFMTNMTLGVASAGASPAARTSSASPPIPVRLPLHQNELPQDRRGSEEEGGRERGREGEREKERGEEKEKERRTPPPLAPSACPLLPAT
jgi:hypothetical protein